MVRGGTDALLHLEATGGALGRGLSARPVGRGAVRGPAPEPTGIHLLQICMGLQGASRRRSLFLPCV